MTTESKKSLRSLIRRKLSALEDDAVAQQSIKAQETILSLPEYKAARRVGVYLSMPTGEARTNLLVKDALDHGKTVFVPYLYSLQKPDKISSKRKVMDMLCLKTSEEYQGLDRDSWGIPTLPTQDIESRENAAGGKGVLLDVEGNEKPGRPTADLDLIVMPAMSFDGDMNRLGHGAGFYDTFLTRLCRDGIRKKPFLIGLCLSEQLLPSDEKIVMEDWDWKVDAVAVGDGSLLTLKQLA